jgi:hypothetical protein
MAGAFNGGTPLRFAAPGPPSLAPNPNEIQQTRSWQEGEGYTNLASTGSSTSDLQYGAVHDRGNNQRYRDGQTGAQARLMLLLNTDDPQRQYRCDSNDPDSCLVQPTLGSMNFGGNSQTARTWVNPGQFIAAGSSVDMLHSGMTHVNGRDAGVRGVTAFR